MGLSFPKGESVTNSEVSTFANISGDAALAPVPAAARLPVQPAQTSVLSSSRGISSPADGSAHRNRKHLRPSELLGKWDETIKTAGSHDVLIDARCCRHRYVAVCSCIHRVLQ